MEEQPKRFASGSGSSDQEADASNSANSSSTRLVLNRVGPSPTRLPSSSSSQNWDQ